MLELVDRHGSEPCAFYKRVGSTPTFGTYYLCPVLVDIAPLVRIADSHLRHLLFVSGVGRYSIISGPPTSAFVNQADVLELVDKQS